MGLKVGDKIKAYDLFPTLRTVGSSSGREATIFSSPMPLGMGRDYAILVDVEHVSTVGPRAPVEVELLAGTATYASPTAYTSVGGMTVMASGATLTGVNYARVAIQGTCTKVGIAGATLVIDGSTFNLAFGGADSSVLVECTAASVTMQKLSSCINRCCTNLVATYYSAGVTTGPAYVDIRPKNGDYVFDITSSSIQNAASVDAIGIIAAKSAMYEFKSDEVAAKSTAKNYDRFAVRLQTTGTVARLGAQVLVSGARYTPNIKIDRAQLGTVSTLHST